MQAERVNTPPSVRLAVLIRDGFRCVYCGATRDDARIEVDHVIPVCKGGTNDIGNLVAACRECNIGKGGKMLIDIVDGDIGTYVKPKGRLVAPVPRIAADDPLRDAPARLWIPVFRSRWDFIDLTPQEIVVENKQDGSPVVFRPTMTCTGRENSDIAPYPCDVRVLVLPWREVGGFTEEEKAQTIAAAISGYSAPTIIILGTPTLFFAVLVNERYKGNPMGYMIDQHLEPFSEWRNHSWYPDECFDFQDLREPFAWVPQELSHRTFDAAADQIVGVYCSFTGEAL